MLSFPLQRTRHSLSHSLPCFMSVYVRVIIKNITRNLIVTLKYTRIPIN